MTTSRHLFFLDVLALLCGAVLVYSFFALPSSGNHIRFAVECLKPFQNKKPLAVSCGSEASIREVYGIDLKAMIRGEWKKLSRTAKGIASGELVRPADYRTCIASGQCAEVPLLPDEASHEKAAGSKDEFLDVRTAFWDMAESDVITPAVCGFIPACLMATEKAIISVNDLREQP